MLLLLCCTLALAIVVYLFAEGWLDLQNLDPLELPREMASMQLEK